MIKKETMTSRQRVLNTLNHKPVDRVPIDFGMHFSTGISAFAYQNLREHLGLSIENIQIADIVHFLPRVDEDVLERFHCDCILLHPGWKRPAVWNPRDNYRFIMPDSRIPERDDGGSWWIKDDARKMRMPEGGFFFDGDHVGTDMDSDEYLERAAKEAERIYKETDYFTTFMNFHAFFNGSNVDWLCRTATDPEGVIEDNERFFQWNIKKAEKVVKLMGNYIQSVTLGADLGTQNGCMIRPSVYEELCAPFVKRLCDFIHQNSDYKIFYHCCGSIKPLIPILIDCGIDALNPVQISANDMDPAELKREFGDKLTFWGGGCDTQNILPNGTVEEVKENVRHLMNIFKPNSGFVFNQVHNIMGNVPPENIVAMFDTAYEESFY